MKCLAFESDREKSPLMKALHAVGVVHGCVIVAVAYERAADGKVDTKTLFIDGKDDTTPEMTAGAYLYAGTTLIQASGAVQEWIAENPGEPPPRCEHCDRTLPRPDARFCDDVCRQCGSGERECDGCFLEMAP